MFATCAVVDRIDYLGYLTRTVPPQRLAQTLAVRLWRTARRPFNGTLAPPPPERILEAFGASTAGSLPRRLAAPIAGPLAFASPQGARAAAALLAETQPAEAERALALAEASLARRITVFGTDVPLHEAQRLVPHATPSYRAIDWERDPLGEARFDDGPPPPGADIKRPWVVGRLDEVVQLACAAHLDTRRSAAFADAALDRVLDLATAPRGVQWTCAMEVSLRAANIAIALRLLAGHDALAARPEALLEILRSLVFHLDHVEHNLEDTVAVPNNHLVSDLVGLALVGALLPRLPTAEARARRAVARLARELDAQTLEDGFTFEASVPYHRLATELFLLGELAARTLGTSIGAERLRRMFHAGRELLDGRGLCPQIGDNDSGRALPFRHRHPQEQAYLLPVGAALFDDASLHLQTASPELVWLLGPAGVKRLSRLPPADRKLRDSSLPAAGIHVLRSRRITCAVACGPNGTGGTGSHGHNDKLSIEVCVDGRLVIGDPGSGGYTADPALRNRLRGTAAHSTVLVDGQEQQELPADRLFALPDQARARCLELTSTPGYGRFVGEHRGYERLVPSVRHRREVQLERAPERLLITDILAGAGAHLAEARFLVACEARVRPLTADERRRLELPEARRWCVEAAVELGPEKAPLAVLVGTSRPALHEAVYAVGYGQLEHALSVCFPIAGPLPTVFTAAVLPVAAGERGRE